MDDEVKIDNGPESDRAKVSKEDTTTETTNKGDIRDGSIEDAELVEQVVEGDNSERKAEKDPKLLLTRANEFRDGAMQIFLNKAKAKYDAGQQEHGGFLPADVSMHDLEDEIIDLWFYLQAMKSKLYVTCKEQKDIIFHKRAKHTDVK